MMNNWTADFPILAADENGNRLVRNSETALGDLAADAYRVMMDADIGIMNGGGLRAPIKEGDITLNDILTVFPWGNLPCKMEVTGQTVLDMLEMGAIKYPSESGGFLSVSGLKYTIVSSIPSSIELSDKGEFVKVAGARRVQNVQVLNKKTGVYEPINPNKTYTLGGIDYTITYCGDGFTMFKNSKVLKAGDATMTDAQTVLSYIETKLGGTIGEQYSKPAGRISIVKYTDVVPGKWYEKAVNYVRLESRLCPRFRPEKNFLENFLEASSLRSQTSLALSIRSQSRVVLQTASQQLLKKQQRKLRQQKRHRQSNPVMKLQIAA